MSYENVKKERKITGFKFKVLENPKTTTLKIQNGGDGNTADKFTVEGLNEKQLGRIACNPQFITDYNHLVSSTSPAVQDPTAWEFEMVNRLKKHPSQFKKRPIKDYLNY